MNANRKLASIAVLVSVGRHSVSGVPRYSRNDAAALEIGRALAAEHRARLDVIHAGDARNPALADYLALGAASVEVLACADGDDAAAALAERVRGHDLVLTGTRAEGAYDTGMLPYRVAAALGWPFVGAAVDVSVDAALPAVVAVHPLANAQPRYAYARLRAGEVRVTRAATRAAADAGQWTTRAVERKPVRLAADDKRSGHARMLSATTTESRGGNVVIEGSSVEKAQVILAYLREHQLIDY
ncbi:electron transfer flavoprotein subunit beta/FixA family protein [Burkholderia mallei]|uniref:electron transfer flavoprotein subunit beta/FixA family protein n=1 Tax=Burkholderia mallei TaxID=13373 RepID=UPI000EA8EEE1|nr:electron transfer flavoprotein subunit beta/FixA family protein [Burkholderia mallei]RKO00558.1 electron transfer flavoprotein subunit beta/FixA family protein [Burkholderia mallei]WPJ33174.1 electron transfer flavoprotein subunit beta/FixA family protein [Burkholderia mallei]WPJ36165.1 electron transfer flavoprotein subunit beta/FixA family protein [Burkholderia mallei]WPJ40967.1 electron transfer flavoprotein subunit beta/FixA family protein [Burkholderia mallei]